MRTALAVPTPWLCRKSMISRTIFCSAQASVMRLARTGPIPVTSRRRSGSASIVSNTFSPKARTSFFCVDRADAPDHAGAQVFLDTVDRRWRRGAHESRLELLAMGIVVDPFAGCGDPLTRGNGRGMSHDRYQVAVTPRLDPENAETVVVIMEGNSLDETGENFLG